ncbi:addiction module antitoxin [Aphanothece hegewaldii CCALA 016]|uniref:Addiction module antitoxin n=1 Tax=Aphanothece hegewaldii CCALA 016 TaxID=2107694 RepID=A0A2T1LS48_9CHRO|nr:type II toxin-antitoxin system RelE/ParE family toxin [Aphanothece hegewaldii]PSF32244.1 addiction module antitoxin [Aphanothece hegewaldii CCALA 016]
MSESNSISIRFADEFENNLYRLSKKYRNIRSDIEPIIQQIQTGNFLGDHIPKLGTDYLVYKVRVNNSNIQKGKRAGYRLIYQVESETSVLLLTIYSKSEKEDINVSEILNILNNFYNSEDNNSL